MPRPAAKNPTATRPPRTDKGLHPRNRHGGRYDFARLVVACPELAAHVTRNAYGDESIDFADPQAVRLLNRALLQQAYGIRGWQLPANYLCPPIPGRADALHHLADLLAASNGGIIPRGSAVRVLDVGVGANCIYPLIGHGEYGWRFVGCDIDRAALHAAQSIVDANDGYREAIELRWQRSPQAILDGVVAAGERFDLTVCNPPFHSSLAEARAGSARKWRHLGRDDRARESADSAPCLNFGGRSNELYCCGGEQAFIARLIAESTHFAANCLWFSSLVAKSASLPEVDRALRRAGVRDSRILPMAQGQKKSRIVAWSYLSPNQRRQWCMTRHGG